MLHYTVHTLLHICSVVQTFGSERWACCFHKKISGKKKKWKEKSGQSYIAHYKSHMNIIKV